MFSVIYFFFYIKLACILEWVCSNLKKKKKKKKKIGRKTRCFAWKSLRQSFSNYQNVLRIIELRPLLLKI